jgi:hypothetical protein
MCPSICIRPPDPASCLVGEVRGLAEAFNMAPQVIAEDLQVPPGGEGGRRRVDRGRPLPVLFAPLPSQALMCMGVA